jgi:hypothetical protein
MDIDQVLVFSRTWHSSFIRTYLQLNDNSAASNTVTRGTPRETQRIRHTVHCVDLFPVLVESILGMQYLGRQCRRGAMTYCLRVIGVMENIKGHSYGQSSQRCSQIGFALYHFVSASSYLSPSFLYYWSVLARESTEITFILVKRAGFLVGLFLVS